jgi:hypothetical protein
MSAQRDRSPIWIGIADLLLCVVSVVIAAVAPTKAKVDGVKPKAEYLITMESSVDIDADPDLWLLMPSGKPVFYASREVGCATLDSDNRGFIDSIITLADGSRAKVESDKETTTLRCIEPGHYEVGVNLYAYRDANNVNLTSRNDLGLKTHVEIVGLNPTLRTLFSRDVTLDSVGQTINVTAFNIDADGKLSLSAPRLTTVTEGFQKTAAP